MILDEQTFAPERPRLRREAMFSILGVLVAGPALFWWRGLPLKWLAPALAFMLAIALGGDLWRTLVRGADSVTLDAEGLRVTNKRRTWRLRWEEIQTVYRFKDVLIFETTPPHRRQSLSLEGHAEHLPELVAAIQERARTKNLGWVQTIADVVG